MTEACLNPTEELFQVNLSESDVARFWSKVDKTGPCWLWTAGKTPGGYGWFQAAGRPWRANRLSCFISKGPFPAKLLCCHTCDNTACVNPEHIYLGTPEDNSRDAVKRLRHFQGQQHHFAKLTEQQVLSIVALHAAGYTDGAIGARLGVASSCVWGIVSGNTWKSVTRGTAFKKRRPGEHGKRDASGNLVLTEGVVVKILNLCGSGISREAVARQFSLSRSTVDRLISHKSSSWRWLTIRHAASQAAS